MSRFFAILILIVLYPILTVSSCAKDVLFGRPAEPAAVEAIQPHNAPIKYQERGLNIVIVEAQ